MSYAKNPIADFLSRRAWKWFTEEELCNAVKCTPQDIKECLNMYAKCTRVIDVAIFDHVKHYRYISNHCSNVYRAIVYLKSIYPECKTGQQIAKAIGVSESVGRKLKGVSEFAPVEELHVKIAGSPRTQYRYIPNDRRSLRDHKQTYSMSHIRKLEREVKKQHVLEVLQRHQGEYITAKDIATEIGYKKCSGGKVCNLLRFLPKDFPIDVEVRYEVRRLKYYRYSAGVSTNECANT